LVAVIGMAVGGFILLQRMQQPRIETMSPQIVRVGEKLTIGGRNFPNDASAAIVLFGDKAAVVAEASAARIVVTVPDVPYPPGNVSRIPVRVKAGRRESSPVEAAIYVPPKIHGLSPDVGMPGEEVVVAGAGWAGSVTVNFADVKAEITVLETTFVRVRVPQITVPQGTSVPVTVLVGEERSAPKPFLMGQLPLVTGTRPATVATGDVVVAAGRGFRAALHENAVKVGGVRALILAAREDEIQFVVPGLDLSGQTSLEVTVLGRANTAIALLNLAPAIDPIPLRFYPEPFIDVAGHEHAAIVTGIGPAFVMSAAGGASAAQRAVDASQRLNAAVAILRTTTAVDIETADLESAPKLRLTGKDQPLIEITAEDITAYAEDWTNLKGKGGLVTASRLAAWWQAVLRDLVLMLVRGEPPRFAADLAPEGRALNDLHQTATQAGGIGVTRALIAALKPAQREGLRLLAFRVPPSVVAGREASGPAATTTMITTTGATASSALRLDRIWIGKEVSAGRPRAIEVRFVENGGTLTYTTGIALSVPILNVKKPRPDAVSFTTEFGGGIRYYAGRWDGQMVRGKISSKPAETGDLGTFELHW
jgi:hypothetical protein